MTVIVVYGLSARDTERWQEALLAETCRTAADVEAVKVAAAKDGWHSFRVARIDLSQPPDFTKVFA